VVKPEPGLAGLRRREYEGVEVADFGYPFRDVPYLRSFLRDDVLHPRLRDFLSAEMRARPADVVHAQHLISAAPSVAAAAEIGVPSVVTVRDAWPICYFTTWHVPGERCPDCTFPKMLACMREKDPRAYWAGVPLMPYMRRTVRRRQEGLCRASAVVAVSRYIAAEVVEPAVGGRAPTHVIPNFVDLEVVDRTLGQPAAVDLPERFWLFAGKLHRLKGALFVLDVARRLRSETPLLVVGDGPEREAMEGRVRDEGLNVRFLPWLDNAEVWRVMRKAELVVVPSLLPEALSRTVLEAMAVGVPVVASDRGGIHDQIRDGETGVIVEPDVALFAERIDVLLGDESIRRRLAAAARERIEAVFTRPVVLERTVALYEALARR
jgi:glycosyltransferase involved in cell wall biosynthesis